jgi:hypothetical protein
VGPFHPPGITWGVDVAGGLAYLAQGFWGLQIFDVSDPGTPTPLGGVGRGGVARGVEVDPDRVLVSDGSALLVDAEDPNAPQILAILSDFVSAVRSRGDLLYATGRNGLEIFDVANPSAPIEQGRLASGAGESLDLEGDHAYIAGGSIGIASTAPKRAGSAASWSASSFA